jgi:cytochrome c551
MKNKFLVILLGAVLMLVLGACGGAKTDKNANGGATTGTGTETETVAVDPEKVVQTSCISCHGGNLEGKVGPALTHIGATLSEKEIHDIIINGRGGMPAIKVSDAEATAVAKWLSEKK